MAAGAAALMAGCSDASRFADPFTDPFSSGSSAPQRYSQNSSPRGYDRAPTGTTRYTPSRVESRPLAPVAPAPHTVTTPVAPVSHATAPIAAAGGSHWSIDGGTPVTVGQGDTAAALATRYGVPTDALLRANGYSSAAQVQPGSRITIPVYRAQASAVAPAAAAPHLSSATVAAPAALTPKQIAEAAELKRRKTEAEAAEARQKDAEAKAAQRLAEAKAAEQKLAEAKATEAKKAELKAAELKKAEARVAEAKSSDKKAAEAKLAAARAESQKAEQAKLAATKDADKAQKAAKLAESQKATEAAKAAQTAKVAEAARTKAATKVAAAPLEEAAPAPKPAAPAPKLAAPEPKAVAAAEPKKIDKTTTTASIPPAAAAPAAAAPVEDEKPVASADGKPEFRWPARGRIIQGYSSGGNDGINIAVPEGTPVKAAEGGTVAYAGSELKGYGNLVLIRHPNGFVTAYAHNGALNVKRGESVKRGQTIATSGQSGNVGSPQLHFELRKGSQPVDPTTYMAGL